MVNAKQAVFAANAFVADLFPEGQDLRLEQIAPAGPNWEVVFSFYIPDHSTMAKLVGQTRSFKAVEVDRQSGEPVSARVWKM